MEFNDWKLQEIIHKDKILNYNFLKENALIELIEDDYYYLKSNQKSLEDLYYEIKTYELAQKLKITDVDVEIKDFIKKLNLYNEIKDIADAMMGKIAELRGTTIQELHDEFDIIKDITL
ncbi:swi5-like zinc finger protein [Gurleya vavrai]